jgi:cobalt/nickel transport system permease protein
LGILILVISTVLIRDLKACFLSLTVALVLLFTSKLPIKFVFEQLKYALCFLFALFFTMLVFGHKPIEMLLRSISALIMVFVAFATSRFDISIKALNRIGFPNKLTQILLFTYRYIFVFAEEYEKMTMSLKMKGFEKKTNRQTFETIAKLIATLFLRSYERAENVYKAMLLKGYTGNPGTITEFKTSWKDFVFLTISICLALLFHLISPYLRP